MTRETPRADCPTKLPDIPPPQPSDYDRYKDMKLSLGKV